MLPTIGGATARVCNVSCQDSVLTGPKCLSQNPSLRPLVPEFVLARTALGPQVALCRPVGIGYAGEHRNATGWRVLLLATAGTGVTVRRDLPVGTTVNRHTG